MRSRKEVLLVVAGAVVVALAALIMSPVLAKNILFLAALPLVAVLFLVLVLNIRHLFIFIILTRAFLDPILLTTRVGGGGSGGIGGVLNLLVILMVVFLVAKRPKVLLGNRYVISWLIFLGWAFITVFYSPYPNRTIKLFINLCTYVAIFITPFFLVNDEKEKRFWIKMILISSFIPVMSANLGIVTQHPLLNIGERLSGAFTHANILAFYTVFIITVTFYILKTRILRVPAPVRILLWLYIVDLLVILVVTQTRSAWISFVGIFLIYGLLKERKMLLVFAIIVSVMLALPPVQERLKDLDKGTGTKHSEKLNSWAWRVHLWQNAMPFIQRRILTGYGLGSFEHVSQQFYTGARWGTPAHNVYLEVLFETGIFGFLAWLTIYFTILKALFRRIYHTAGQHSTEAAIVFCYIIGYLIMCVSDNVQYYLAVNWYIWFFLGVILRGMSLKE